MKTVSDLKVGDTVWYTDVNFKGLHETVVSKIGTKLITTKSGWREVTFRKDTLKSNDAYAHQTLIPDKAAYLEDQEKRRIIRQIATDIFYSDQNKFSLETLNNVASVLGIKID